MRTINVCLIILMFTIGISKSFDFAALNEIQSLKQNSFASSLIETISLSLSASKGEDASGVLDMLNDLKNQLKSDQEKDNKTYTLKNDEFQAHIDKLTKDISDLYSEIKILADRIIVLSGLIIKAEANIVSFGKRIVDLNTTIDEIEAIFNSDEKYYNQKIDGLGVLETKMRLVISTVSKMIGSVSGDGKYSHINATETEKRDMEWRANNPIKKSFLQIKKMLPEEFASLAELTLTADQKSLQKLISILEKITLDIVKEKKSKEDYLENMRKSFQDLKKQMIEEIAANKKALGEQEENKRNYENEKGAKEKEKLQKENRKASLEEEKKINIDLQTNLKNTHDKETADRNKEVEIVNVLIGIVEKRLVKKQ